MNRHYQRLLQSLSRVEERVNLFESAVAEEENNPYREDYLEAIRQFHAAVEQIRPMLEQVAQSTEQDVPAQWDLVSMVPADQQRPEEAEGYGQIPYVGDLDKSFGQGMDQLEQMRELMKRHGGFAQEQREVWGMYLEQVKNDFHRIYQLSRGAHDPTYYEKDL